MFHTVRGWKRLFKSKMNAASRRKNGEAGPLDYKWTKSPEMDSFITSTIPKDVTRSDNAAQKTQRQWLEAVALLAAIVDKKIGVKFWRQSIRNALRNVSQQHFLQRRKTILQHLNPQLKSLVQNVDFRWTE